MKHPRSIALLCFPPVDILDVAGPLEVFRLANLLSRDPPYAVTVINARDEAMLETEAGVNLSTHATVAQLSSHRGRLEKTDTLIVTSGLSAINCYPTDALDWIVRHQDQFRRICSVCLGAFPLAASGVLDGRRVTTHWRLLDLLSSLHQTIDVDESPIWVKDEKFYSSAGLSTGIDLTLSLVEEDLGHKLANDIAKEMVLYVRRSATHSQNSLHLERQNTPNKRLQALQVWLLENLDKHLTIERLAERLSVSRRTLIRLFHAELKTTPGQHIETLRLDAVARYLATTDWSLEYIASKSGFASVDVMRRAFQKKHGVPLATYRQTAKAAPPWRTDAVTS